MGQPVKLLRLSLKPVSVRHLTITYPNGQNYPNTSPTLPTYISCPIAIFPPSEYPLTLLVVLIILIIFVLECFSTLSTTVVTPPIADPSTTISHSTPPHPTYITASPNQTAIIAAVKYHQITYSRTRAEQSAIIDILLLLTKGRIRTKNGLILSQNSDIYLGGEHQKHSRLASSTSPTSTSIFIFITGAPITAPSSRRAGLSRDGSRTENYIVPGEIPRERTPPPACRPHYKSPSSPWVPFAGTSAMSMNPAGRPR